MFSVPRVALKVAAGAAMLSLLAVQPSAQSLPSWAAPSEYAPADAEAASVFDVLESLAPCPPGQSPDGSGGCIPDPPPPVPVDGGLGLLAIAGAGLAARRLRRRSP